MITCRIVPCSPRPPNRETLSGSALTTLPETAEVDSAESVAFSAAASTAAASTAAAAESPAESPALGAVKRPENTSSSPRSRRRAVFRGDADGGLDGLDGGAEDGVFGAWGDGDGMVADTDDHDAAAGDGHRDDGGALDFVFFATGGDGGVSCGGYDVRREFSQQRFADGYPSVAEFDVSCPSLPDASLQPV